jgi:UDP-N-acetylmuramoyl-tripeptide--D-alanyl-D-alanine ligase
VDAKGELLEITLPMPGRHNVLNALAAIAVGKELGIGNQAIVSGLADPELTGKRLRMVRQDNYSVIDDTYNASPASVKAALDVLADLDDGQRKLAVLADMLELGTQAGEIHYDMGRYAASRGIDWLLTYGDLSNNYVSGYKDAGGKHGRFFEAKDELIRELRDNLRDGDVILVKGSRGMKMEEVVAALIKEEAR